MVRSFLLSVEVKWREPVVVGFRGRSSEVVGSLSNKTPAQRVTFLCHHPRLAHTWVLDIATLNSLPGSIEISQEEGRRTPEGRERARGGGEGG